MKSPKLAGRSPWYPYYAAFSAEFVDEALDAIGPVSGPIVDPWNGSGTTTAAARRTGLPAFGVDANPALVVVGKGRLLSPGVRDSLKPLAKDLIAHAIVDRHP